ARCQPRQRPRRSGALPLEETNRMQEHNMQEHYLVERRDQRGFTLIELLIAIVVVGILTAVAIVGIGGLVDNGHTAPCSATSDASKTAQAVYFANHSAYPTTFTEMVNDKVLDGNGATVAAGTITGKGWTLTIANGGTITGNPPVSDAASTFTCS